MCGLNKKLGRTRLNKKYFPFVFLLSYLLCFFHSIQNNERGKQIFTIIKVSIWNVFYATLPWKKSKFELNLKLIFIRKSSEFVAKNGVCYTKKNIWNIDKKSVNQLFIKAFNRKLPRDSFAQELEETWFFRHFWWRFHLIQK